MDAYTVDNPELNTSTSHSSGSSQVCQPTTQRNTFYRGIYRKVSNVRRTKSPNLDVSRLVVQLSSNPMKPGVKSRMKM